MGHRNGDCRPCPGPEARPQRTAAVPLLSRAGHRGLCGGPPHPGRQQGPAGWAWHYGSRGLRCRSRGCLGDPRGPRRRPSWRHRGCGHHPPRGHGRDPRDGPTRHPDSPPDRRRSGGRGECRTQPRHRPCGGRAPPRAEARPGGLDRMFARSHGVTPWRRSRRRWGRRTAPCGRCSGPKHRSHRRPS